MDAERFLLKWNNHQSNLVTVFDQLYEQEAFTDVTLACDGRSFAAHKVILSACSPYFQQLFVNNPCNHPIIFMRDVKAADLDALLAFMYRGEINVHQQDLPSFLKTAESLQIKGLSDSSDKPRDTSKILEAVEKKFPNTNNSNHIGMQLGNFLNSSIQRSSPMNAMIPALTNFGRALHQQNNNNNNNNNRSYPNPSKKRKHNSEDFQKILPKIKSYGSAQMVSAVPGLVTPISLATTVMKGSPTPQLSPRASEGRASPSEETSPEKGSQKEDGSSDGEKELGDKTFVEGFIPGDTPHSVFLVSSVGGIQGMNSSGNSTPSAEVKIEEEDTVDENHIEDNGSFSQMESPDVTNYVDELQLNNRDRLTYPCKFCGKRFTQTGTCRRHERLHIAPNSFKCPFCMKGFNRKYRLKEHIFSAHPEHTENPDLSMLINNSDSTLA